MTDSVLFWSGQVIAFGEFSFVFGGKLSCVELLLQLVVKVELLVSALLASSYALCRYLIPSLKYRAFWAYLNLIR